MDFFQPITILILISILFSSKMMKTIFCHVLFWIIDSFFDLRELSNYDSSLTVCNLLSRYTPHGVKDCVKVLKSSRFCVTKTNLAERINEVDACDVPELYFNSKIGTQGILSDGYFLDEDLNFNSLDNIAKVLDKGKSIVKSEDSGFHEYEVEVALKLKEMRYFLNNFIFYFCFLIDKYEAGCYGPYSNLLLAIRQVNFMVDEDLGPLILFLETFLKNKASQASDFRGDILNCEIRGDTFLTLKTSGKGCLFTVKRRKKEGVKSFYRAGLDLNSYNLFNFVKCICLFKSGKFILDKGVEPLTIFKRFHLAHSINVEEIFNFSEEISFVEMEGRGVVYIQMSDKDSFIFSCFLVVISTIGQFLISRNSKNYIFWTLLFLQWLLPSTILYQWIFNTLKLKLLLYKMLVFFFNSEMVAKIYTSLKLSDSKFSFCNFKTLIPTPYRKVVTFGKCVNEDMVFLTSSFFPSFEGVALSNLVKKWKFERTRLTFIHKKDQGRDLFTGRIILETLDKVLISDSSFVYKNSKISLSFMNLMDKLHSGEIDGALDNSFKCLGKIYGHFLSPSEIMKEIVECDCKGVFLWGVDKRRLVKDGFDYLSCSVKLKITKFLNECRIGCGFAIDRDFLVECYYNALFFGRLKLDLCCGITPGQPVNKKVFNIPNKQFKIYLSDLSNLFEIMGYKKIPLITKFKNFTDARFSLHKVLKDFSGEVEIVDENESMSFSAYGTDFEIDYIDYIVVDNPEKQVSSDSKIENQILGIKNKIDLMEESICNSIRNAELVELKTVQESDRGDFKMKIGLDFSEILREKTEKMNEKVNKIKMENEKVKMGKIKEVANEYCEKAGVSEANRRKIFEKPDRIPGLKEKVKVIDLESSVGLNKSLKEISKQVSDYDVFQGVKEAFAPSKEIHETFRRGLSKSVECEIKIERKTNSLDKNVKVKNPNINSENNSCKKLFPGKFNVVFASSSVSHIKSDFKKKFFLSLSLKNGREKVPKMLKKMKNCQVQKGGKKERDGGKTVVLKPFNILNKMHFFLKGMNDKNNGERGRKGNGDKSDVDKQWGKGLKRDKGDGEGKMKGKKGFFVKSLIRQLANESFKNSKAEKDLKELDKRFYNITSLKLVFKRLKAIRD